MATAMRHTIQAGLTGLLAALLAGTVLAAPIYKWQDAEGRIHYEDTRPPEGDVQVIKPPTVYRGEPTGQTTQAGEPSDSTTGTDVDERERNCAKSREALAQAQGAGRMYTLDEQGNRTYLGTAEIEAHIAKLQEAVDTWCGTQ